MSQHYRVKYLFSKNRHAQGASYFTYVASAASLMKEAPGDRATRNNQLFCL